MTPIELLGDAHETEFEQMSIFITIQVSNQLKQDKD